MKLPIRFLRYFNCAVFAMPAASAAARPGDLDIFFNPTGEGSPPGMVLSPPSNFTTSLQKIAILPDGKIAGMGTAFNQYALMRWLPDGSLDPAFGIGGIAQLPPETNVILNGIAVQTDGRILVACHHTSASVLRVLPDGTLDASFGNGGEVFLGLPDTSSKAAALAVLSDGKILVGGELMDTSLDGNYRPRVWQLLPDGSLDPAFGNAGAVTLSGPGNISQIAVQADHKIVASGAGEGGVGAWVGRFDASGALDPFFANGGRFTVTQPLNLRSSNIRLVLQSNGKILIAGDFQSGHSDIVFFVNRFDQDGSPDVTFGGSGRITTNITGGLDILEELSLQADGKVLVAGTSGEEAVLVRYLTNGTLDPNFAAGGIAKFRVPARQCNAQTMAVQPDGKILLGGNAFDLNQMLLVRVSGNSLPESLDGEWPVGTPLQNGGTVDMGTVLRGDPSNPETTVTLRNSGPVPLTNLSRVIAGPSAARFTLLSPLPPTLNPGESMTLHVRFLPPAEVSSVAASLTIETGDPGIEDFLIVFRGATLSPVATLALSEGAAVIAENATVDFGPALATHPVTKIFTIRNSGNIDLLLQGISLGTAGTPADFTVGALETDVLAAGASTMFPVTFTPGGSGARTARLRIASTDTFHFPYEITLTGSLAAGMDAWRLTHFGTLLNEGDAADFSDPDGDGIVNLMEYATLTNPNAPDPPAPGEVALSGNLMEYTFMRPAGATDQLIYSMEWSLSPEGPWGGVAPLTVLSDDGTRQRVRFSLSVVNSPRRFVRLRVERK